MKYAFIDEQRPHHALSVLCRVMEVSRSGYHDWRRGRDRSASRRHARRAEIDTLVRELFEAKRARYGAPRLACELRRRGQALNRKTVAASLARQGLRARAAKRFRATTNSRHSLPVYPDRLEQKFGTEGPNEKWVQDITYLWSDEGWSYLAVVIDLYSRGVIGWSLEASMSAELVCSALRMALASRGHPRGVIVHSDRGSQYCSNAFRGLVENATLVGSMSRKGCCHDNAVAESFFHSLKIEAIHGERIGTREELQRRVFEYIELDYNRERLHSTLGYVSPSKFEQGEVA